jgi:hypothetical protein
MKYEEFNYIIMLYKKTSEEFSNLHDIGFDFFEGKYKLSESFYNLVSKIFEIHYDDLGIDMINWFIFETNYGMNDLKAYDKDKNLICYSLESLYNYIEENHKKINDK